MKTFVFFIPFLIVILSFTKNNEAAKKKKISEPVANSTEINKHLFGDPNDSTIEKYKNKTLPPFNVVRGGDDFNLERDVNFIFKSKSARNGQTFTFAERDTLTSENIDATKPLRVIIHGWQNKADSPMIMNVSEAYLQTQDVNVMIVDWSELAKENYLKARYYIKDVANVTGHFIKYLVDNGFTKISNIHLIGHSLGGHTVGLVGKKVQELKLGKIPLICALDPAGPLFNLDERDMRVDKDDAKLVVILHTSTILGFTEPLGHVDFYANFGFSQPGCSPDPIRTCAHSRAYLYFAEAILSQSAEKDIWAIKCNADYDEIEGEECNPSEIEERFGATVHREPKSLDGLFVFQTNSEQPWAKPRAHLKDLGSSLSTDDDDLGSSASTINFIWGCFVVIFTFFVFTNRINVNN